MSRNIILLTFMVFCQSCIKTEQSNSGTSPEYTDRAYADSLHFSGGTEPVFSLVGEVFPSKAFEGREKQRRVRQLFEARTKYENNPDNLSNIIWYGRRLGYLGQYKEAVAVYSLGIEKFPESHKLYRHRGEAYIIVRDFDGAVQDLERAAFLAEGKKNESEENGLSNRSRVVLRNVSFNIWYHLGLSYYLKGDFDKAISAYKKCLEVSDNNDLMVAATVWLYRTYAKIGNVEEAQNTLDAITPDMKVVETGGYLNLLLLFKEEVSAERIRELALRRDDSLDPTVGYGLGNWFVLRGNVETAKETFDRVLAGNSWDSFGYIASEVERANLTAIPL